VLLAHEEISLILFVDPFMDNARLLQCLKDMQKRGGNIPLPGDENTNATIFVKM